MTNDMKKLIPVAAFALLALSASCKRHYTCECRRSVPGSFSDARVDLGKYKKKDAEAECKSRDYSATENGVPVTRTCRLIE